MYFEKITSASQFQSDIDQVNAKKGLYWLEQSAKNGFSKVQITLGDLYIFRDAEFLEYTTSILDGDNSTGAYWYEKATKKGNAEAQFNLGLYYWGVGSDIGVHYRGDDPIPDDPVRDAKKAIYWYTKSAEQGYKSAQEKL